MSLNILSDLDVWNAVAYVPAVDDNGAEIEGKVQIRPEAYTLIVVGSVSIGMGELNQDTASEWLARLRALEAVYGALMTRHDGNEYVDVPVTMAHLEPYFGTRTNVFPKESAAKFATRMGRTLMSELMRRTD